MPVRLVFADKSAADAGDLTATTERLVNFYPAQAPEGGKARFILRSVPGVADHVDLGGPFLRRMVEVGGRLYALAGGALYRIAPGGSSAYLADVPDDANATMSGYRFGVGIVADGTYLHYANGAMTEPTGGRVTPGSIEFVDQYTLFGEREGREIEWTEIGDPVDLNALYFATAEADDDFLVRIIRYGAYLAVMKENTTELWASTGLGGVNAFARIPGAVWGTGLRSFNLVTTLGVAGTDGLFFVGTDRTARLALAGGAPQHVSTAAVDEALKNGTPTHCFYYEDRGHRFGNIHFDDRPTWALDFSTGRWHERALGADHKPWDVICSAFCHGRWYLGSRLGKIYTLQSLPMDSGAVMRRTAVSRPLYQDGARFTVAMLEFLGRFGRASINEVAPNWVTNVYGFPILTTDGTPLLRSEQGDVSYHNRPVQMWIRVSRDGGNTFGPAKFREIGRSGQYDATCRYRAMGQFRNMVVELNISDPADVPFLAEASVA
jgi:hypothetical protein